jgi:hypothetical protein
MDSAIWFNVLLVLIALAVASRGFNVDEDHVARWADSAGLKLTHETRGRARHYLVWSRRFRTAGGLGGFVTGVAFDLEVTAQRDLGSSSVLMMFVGYLLGALFAELVINRPGPRPGPTVPGPRRLGDYLSRYLLMMQRGSAILFAVLVAAYALLAPNARVAVPDTASIASFGLGGVCLAAVIEALQRLIIGRRQTATSVEDLAVDDALRSSSAHLVAGAGIALLIFFAAGLITALLTIVDTPAGVFSFVVILFLFPFSIAFWLDSGKPHGFRVRHRGLEVTT